MPIYTGADDPNLPQEVKDKTDDYTREVFVFWNNSSYKYEIENGTSVDVADETSARYGREAMDSYAENGIVTVASINTGAT